MRKQVANADMVAHRMKTDPPVWVTGDMEDTNLPIGVRWCLLVIAVENLRIELGWGQAETWGLIHTGSLEEAIRRFKRTMANAKDLEIK